MYFDRPGKENTAKTIELAVQAVKEKGIRHVVLATSTGYTGLCFPALEGVSVICVPHAYGFKEPGKNELSDETIRQLRGAKPDCKIFVGGAVLTPSYAEKIGADYYAKDAKQAVDIAKEVFGG